MSAQHVECLEPQLLRRILDADTHEEAAHYLAQEFDSITEEEHAAILKEEQHHADDGSGKDTANLKWKKARHFRFTGSIQGALAHCNGFCSHEQQVEKKVHPVPRDEEPQRMLEACAYGTKHEDDAEEMFDLYIAAQVGEKGDDGLTLVSYYIENLGLYVCKQEGYGYVGMSPDGVLYTTWRDDETGAETERVELIEYKCPVSWQNKMGNEKIYKYEWIPKRFPPSLREKLGEWPPCENERQKIAVPPTTTRRSSSAWRSSGAPGWRCPHATLWSGRRSGLP